MKCLRLARMAWLGVAAGLGFACSGKVQSLGERGAGGEPRGTGFGGGTYQGGAGGNANSSGGNANSSGGNFYSMTGGGPSAWGGQNNLSVGGAPPVNVNVYPEVPTVPLDSACTCSTREQVCNAAHVCVNRCNLQGACAQWLTNRAVTDLYLDESTVYYATSASTDPLGNPKSDGALYRVTYPNGSPTMIATGLGEPLEILGRYAGSTYLVLRVSGATGLYRVGDAGEVANLSDFIRDRDRCAMRDNWLVYSVGSRLYRIDLAASLAPELLLEFSTLPRNAGSPDLAQELRQIHILDDYIWFGTSHDFGCTLELSSLQQGPNCVASAGGPYAISAGNRLYSAVAAYDHRGQRLLTLMQENSAYCSTTRFSQGFLYSICRAYDHYWFLRYPAMIGRLPQEALDSNVITGAYSELGVEPIVKVNAHGIFWAQRLRERTSSQYIFHAPLPPQPCDAELTCVDGTQVCSDGYCQLP